MIIAPSMQMCLLLFSYGFTGGRSGFKKKTKTGLRAFICQRWKIKTWWLGKKLSNKHVNIMAKTFMKYKIKMFDTDL